MRTIRFFGYSDDLVEVRGTDPVGRGEPDEFYPGADDRAVLRIADGEGAGLYVVVQRLGRISGTWSVGIAPLSDHKPLPAWPMRWSFGADDYDAQFELSMQGLASTPCQFYSTQLEIDAPVDAVVRRVYPQDDD